MVLGDLHLGDVILSILWFFFLFVWILIMFNIIGDLFRDHEASGLTKTLWIVALVFLPFLGSLIYLIVRGKGMGERALAAQKQAQSQFDDYVKQVAAKNGGSGDAPSAADQIEKAKSLLDSGAIDQAEFDKLKAQALA